MVTTVSTPQISTPDTSQPMTAEMLLQLPRGKQRYELIEGELIVMSPAGVRHGRIAMRIGSLLDQYVHKHHLGAVYAAETGFKLRENPDTVRAADAAFVAQERIPADGEPEGYWAIAPDLIVEVVSPSDSASKVQAKVRDWLETGCRLVWVIYPETQTVTVYRSFADIRVLTAGESLEGQDVLPDFSCPIHKIFE